MIAPIESNIFLCACACSGSVFLNNSAISSIFLNSAHMPKQLDYRARRCLETTSCECILGQSVFQYGILPQTSKYGEDLLVIKSKPGNLSQSGKGDEMMKNKFKCDPL